MWVVNNRGEYYAIDSAAGAAYWARSRDEAFEMTYEDALSISRQFGGKPERV